jgi:hypothetical protein
MVASTAPDSQWLGTAPPLQPNPALPQSTIGLPTSSPPVGFVDPSSFTDPYGGLVGANWLSSPPPVLDDFDAYSRQMLGDDNWTALSRLIASRPPPADPAGTPSPPAFSSWGAAMAAALRTLGDKSGVDPPPPAVAPFAAADPQQRPDMPGGFYGLGLDVLSSRIGNDPSGLGFGADHGLQLAFPSNGLGAASSYADPSQDNAPLQPPPAATPSGRAITPIPPIDSASLRSSPAGGLNLDPTYTVQPGDTPWGIARGHYADLNAGLGAMLAANGLKTDPRTGSPIVVPGQILTLPDISGLSQVEQAQLHRDGGQDIAANQQRLTAYHAAQARAAAASSRGGGATGIPFGWFPPPDPNAVNHAGPVFDWSFSGRNGLPAGSDNGAVIAGLGLNGAPRPEYRYESDGHTGQWVPIEYAGPYDYADERREQNSQWLDQMQGSPAAAAAYDGAWAVSGEAPTTRPRASMAAAQGLEGVGQGLAGTYGEAPPWTGASYPTLEPTAPRFEPAADEPIERREPKIPTIGGSPPRNSRYAGGTHPSGVRFNKQGFPDFTPYATKTVKLARLTGTEADTRMANKVAGLSKTPNGYLWHHFEDGHTMQLVPRDIHTATGHTGGAAVIGNGGYDK